MLRCWKKKRNPLLDHDPACEGLLIKYYVRYKHNKDNVDYERNKSYKDYSLLFVLFGKQI